MSIIHCRTRKTTYHKLGDKLILHTRRVDFIMSPPSQYRMKILGEFDGATPLLEKSVYFRSGLEVCVKTLGDFARDVFFGCLNEYLFFPVHVTIGYEETFADHDLKVFFSIDCATIHDVERRPFNFVIAPFRVQLS